MDLTLSDRPPLSPQRGTAAGLETFFAVAFGIPWATEIALWAWQAHLPLESGTMLILCAPLLMWPPMLGAILARRVEHADGADAGWRLPTAKALGVAWAIPVLLVVVTLLVSMPIYPLDLRFPLLREMIARSPKPVSMPIGLVVLLQVLAGLTVGPVFNVLATIGEEAGWRGYLLPRLLAHFGFWPALIGHGVVWGVWHAPIIWLLGHNYPARPHLGTPHFVVFCVLLGIVFGWLQLASRSVWAPALAHGVVNAMAGLPMLFLRGMDPLKAGAVFSTLGWAVVGAVVVLLIRSRSFATVRAGG
jgi:membrane protease YdiL (CAAX protease family)